MALNATVASVTEDIVKRSRDRRRHYLDRIRSEPRSPTGSEILTMIDGLLQLIERRDYMDLLRHRATKG